jgi:hypothetical protein
MAHNNEVGGSGTSAGDGENWPLNLNLEEEAVLHQARHLVSPYYQLPHG